jgi:hypothetical protein
MLEKEQAIQVKCRKRIKRTISQLTKKKGTTEETSVVK